LKRRYIESTKELSVKRVAEEVHQEKLSATLLSSNC
jgi:hypothetical protein